MNTSTFSSRKLFYKTFIFSLLLHLLIFQVCIFTFTVKERPPDPFFMFLGPILKDRDVTIQAFLSSPKNTGKASTLTINIPLDEEGPDLTASQSKKPAFSSTISHSSKIHKKSIFVETLSAPKRSEAEIREILGIDPSTPERIPLRLR